MTLTSRIQNVAIVGVGIASVHLELVFVCSANIFQATGHIGAYFVEALLKTGMHTLTLLTRDAAQPSLPNCANIIQVDYDDHSSLVSALKNQEFLIVTLAVRAPTDTNNKLARAAADAGVSYIMPSIYGMDIRSPKFSQETNAAVVKQLLAEVESLSPLSYICLACGVWYEWSLALGEKWFGFRIKDRKVTFIDDGMTTLRVSTWLQCGRAVASVLSLPETEAKPALADWKNEPLYIESFQVSQRDMLDSLHRVLGTTDQEWEITYETATQRVQDGLAEVAGGDFTGMGKHLYGKLFARSREDGSFPATANSLLGLPSESLDEATKRAVDMVMSGWNPLG